MGVTNIPGMFRFPERCCVQCNKWYFPESVLTEGCYIQPIGFFLLRCSLSLPRCPFAHLMGIRYIQVGVLALFMGVIATCRAFSLSQGAAGAGEESYPTEGAPEPPPWHSGPLTAKVLAQCSSQSGGRHRHPRGMNVRDCPAGELPSRMLCAIRVTRYQRVLAAPWDSGIT